MTVEFDAVRGSALLGLIHSDVLISGADRFCFYQKWEEYNQGFIRLFVSVHDNFSEKQRGFQAGIVRLYGSTSIWASG